MAEDNQVSTIVPDSNPEVENLKKQLTDAQKKITEQGGVLQEQAKYVRDADTVAQLIQANPDLRAQLKSAYEKQYGGGVVETRKEPSKQSEKEPTEKDTTKVADPKIEELDKSVGDIERQLRSKAIKDFEDNSGISNLPDEQKGDVRRKIEEYLNTFGQSVGKVPMSMMSEVLDKANKAINVEQMVEDGRMEGMAELYRNTSGGMPHMQGRRIEAEKEEALTPEQIEWANKLKVPLDQAKEIIKDKENEQDRKSGAEVRKEKRDKGEIK